MNENRTNINKTNKNEVKHMEKINNFIQIFNSMELEKNYSFEEKEFVAKYFYNMFEELSKMRIIDNGEKRELSEVEKFLFMYINITSKVKDHVDNNNATSNDIIGSILTNTAVCQGYTRIMQFICNELSIPFLYKLTQGVSGLHGNFQVIVKDNNGVEHCLHCDSYIDAPDDENDTITFNATLISANDMNNYHNYQNPSSEFLFWDIVHGESVEKKKEQIESLGLIEELNGMSLEEATKNHYNDLKQQIINLSSFIQCEIGDLETRQDILNAYQIMKSYYDKTNLSIDRDELYDMIKKIYVSYNIIILNMSNVEAVKNAEEKINKQIENTVAKHKEKWIK